MHVQNRAAEYGGEIISDTDVHPFASRLPIAVRVLEATIITAITSPDMVGIDYYDGAALDETSPVILVNVATIQLTSGAVQLLNPEG
jgi:hypothetical protein